MMKVDRRRADRQRRIATALAEIGFALPGSLTVKAYRCGKARCRCKADPPQLHGPYAFWTRKVDGKTVTRMLTDDELADYQPLFDNARKLRALVSELQELTVELVEDNGHRRAKTANTPHPAPAPARRPKATKTQPR
ncbi:MAG: hypothetical protein LC799_04305 [Actinobacteria bacterium]|nr:hypothetical protein [Actinomycetota bacterium]